MSTASPDASATPVPPKATSGKMLALLFALSVAFVGGAVLLGRSMMRSETIPLPTLATVPPFELTRENGAPFSSSALDGKVWVANCIFTSCTTVCPKLTGVMSQLQKETAADGAGIAFVSLSVDPYNDTPAALEPYARRAGADASRWAFLTGTEEALRSVIVDGMKLAMDKNGGDNLMAIAHASRFVLVDGQRRVRGLYRVEDEGVVQKMAADARRLVQESTR